MMFIFATQRALANDSKLAFAADLNALMYPGITDYDAAVKAFQTDLGEKPTGILTVWEIHKLTERAETQRLGTVLFPTNFFSAMEDDLALNRRHCNNVRRQNRMAYQSRHRHVLQSGQVLRIQANRSYGAN